MRHELSWQRVTRSTLLTHRHISESLSELSRLDSLQGVVAGVRRCVIGSLLQIENSIYLEDSHAVVKLDTSHAKTFGGFFGEGMVVIAEGSIDSDGVLVVDTLGHPPSESRAAAYCAIGGRQLNVFLGDYCERDITHDAPWIIIANCHLDSPATLPRIRSLLVGLALPMCQHYHNARKRSDGNSSPKRPVIVFLGDFSSSTSAHRGTSVIDGHQRRFGELGTFLCAPELNIGQESVVSLVDLVFIPGPHDPVAGASEALPRARLLQQVVQPLIDRLKAKTDGTAPIFTTSPARFRYGRDEEIVIHRDDTLRKLRQLSRHVTIDVNSSELFDASVHLAKTLLDQCHLAPFTSAFAPKHWNYDHALQLYPPPSILCLGDNTAPSFETVYNDATVFNPGNFTCEGSFVLFRPSTSNIEISEIL